jgi:phosphomannomutase
MLLERGASLAGEYSGHIFFGELGGVDDALYAALLMASLLADDGRPASAILGAMPTYATTPDIRVHFTGDKADMIARAAAAAEADGATILQLDGVKALYPTGWALLRGSVTESALTLRFESTTPDATLAIARRFTNALPELQADVVQKAGRLLGTLTP